MSTLLQAENLSKRYFRKTRNEGRYFDAVSNVSLELKGGELVGLVGRSGSGKSTLLNMLAGLLAPDEGSVSLDGQDLYSLNDGDLSKLRNAKMGVIPQGQTPLYNLSVIANVKLPYLMYGHFDDIDTRAMELLRMMDIEHLSESYPSELSGGEMRRMSIARSLVCSPKVVFADEPTGDLDDENTEVVFSLLRKIADDGAAVLLVTHEQGASRYADRILRMNAGTIVEGQE